LLGTIVNAGAIIAGALLGNLLKNGFPEKYKSVIMQGVSLAVILIGLSMALKSQNLLVLTLSMVSGGILGEWLRIEERLDSFGEKLEGRFNGGAAQKGNRGKGGPGKDNSGSHADSDGLFIKGFVSGSLVFCVGAMAIMGSLESGLTGRHTTLFIKSILDGVTSTVFASSMGIGVAFSALPVFLYQGAITLAACYVKPFLTEAMITEMSAAGGLLIFAIGINMLTNSDRLRIKVGNLLPAIFLAILFVALVGRLPL
jgi:hypothetical protein